VAVQLIDRLLCAALVEARSFERLRLLGEHHPEPELAELFARFARSEARHGATFVSLARNVAARHGIERAEVDDRLEVLTRLEGELVESLPLRCAIH
jgi:tRNA-(ms[2]io[6]A)-hydroxylase